MLAPTWAHVGSKKPSWAVLEASWAVLPRPEGSVVLQRPLGTLQEVVEGSGLGRGRRRGLKGGAGGVGRKPRDPRENLPPPPTASRAFRQRLTTLRFRKFEIEIESKSKVEGRNRNQNRKGDAHTPQGGGFSLC